MIGLIKFIIGALLATLLCVVALNSIERAAVAMNGNKCKLMGRVFTHNKEYDQDKHDGSFKWIEVPEEDVRVDFRCICEFNGNNVPFCQIEVSSKAESWQDFDREKQIRR